MRNKALITIFLIVFIDLLGFGIILPLLPFIAEEYQATPTQIGLLVATYSFFQFIASPVLGRLSDRYGRKKLLIISQLGSAVGFLLLGMAHTLPLLFLSRIIDGITGGNISIAQAYIADVTDKKNRAKGMGLIGAAFGLGFMLGPVIGGVLSNISFATPAFFAAAVATITAITTAMFLKETVDVKKASHSKKTEFTFNHLLNTLQTHPLGLLIIVFFLISLGFSGLQAVFALWAARALNFGPTEIGYIFAYIGLVAIIMQLKALPMVVKKIGERQTLIYSLPLIVIGFILIPFSMNWPMLLFANTLIIMGNSLANPTIQAIASENVDKRSFGATLGILQASSSLGRILGPMYAGKLFDLYSKNTPFITSAFIIFIAFILVKTYLPKNHSPLEKLILKLQNSISR